ncbi:MAG: hypothetical protein MZW92_74210 [Comamonadaceae bacterium]|nr:hypothetical protein [Comamonadaceae bacterium]
MRTWKFWRLSGVWLIELVLGLAHEWGGAGNTASVERVAWQIHEQIVQRWQSALTHEAAGKRRANILAPAVSSEAIQLFRLGFAARSLTTATWARKGWDLQLRECGLVVRKGGMLAQLIGFSGRLMFLICG